MNALVAVLALLTLSAIPTAYRIDLKGGVTYWSSAKPAERSGRYVFRTSDGTLMSIRRSDVARIRQSLTPAKPNDEKLLGPTSPAAAARNQKVVATQLHDARKNGPNGLFKQGPYRPGVGLPYPPAANDYKVGKTFAYPPSGTVYEGLPPGKVPEGPAPMLETPPPPPPER
jgi:hypothetical protein